jgi:hypothetical protein
MLTSNHPFSRRRLARPLLLALVAASPAFVAGGCIGTSNTGPERSGSSEREALNQVPKHPHKALCPKAPPRHARCHAYVRTKADGNVQPFDTPSGLTPADLVSAYEIPSGEGSATVAIVDAYDNPNAESDLAVYRQQFGLPPCTTANGCFKKVNESGQASPLPIADTGWAGEIALDLDMVSAICPSCNILLVEANSASYADLGAGVNMAASLSATVISNSYGGAEDSSAPSMDAMYYDHPGIAVLASSGDNGFGVEFPASGAHVIAVGGTTLTKSSADPRGWVEGAWPGAGSGCSAYVAKPSWQMDPGCANRTVADVSAVADPNTGVAVYITYGATGWVVYGGTSAASPIFAAALAAAGRGSIDAGWLYAHPGAFHDVTSGSNGTCSGAASYLCNAGPGYDGPTGLGTPDGLAIADASGTGGSSSSSSSGSTGGSTTSSSSGSGAGGGTGSSSSSSSGGPGTTCDHPVCTPGAQLTADCDPCAAQVCASDPYCCDTAWDTTCVSEADTTCGAGCSGSGSSSSSSSGSAGASSSSSGSGGSTSCAHAICTSGSMLDPSCDPCAASICASDAYCCGTAWDTQCVGEVGSICGQTCN